MFVFMYHLYLLQFASALAQRHGMCLSNCQADSLSGDKKPSWGGLRARSCMPTYKCVCSDILLMFVVGSFSSDKLNQDRLEEFCSD